MTVAGDNPSTRPPDRTGIQVTLRTPIPCPGSVLRLTGFRARLQVDDEDPVDWPWGTSFVAAAPGRHTLRAFVPYSSGYPELGDASVEVDVAPAQVVAARWRSPWMYFTHGRWKVVARGHTAA